MGVVVLCVHQCVYVCVCVIKGMLRLPCLQLPDAKALMNDFNLAEDGNWHRRYYDSPALC